MLNGSCVSVRLATLMYTIYKYNEVVIILAQTPEIEQHRGRFLSCGARKPEQT